MVQGNDKIKLINAIDYIIKDSVFTVINSKYIPIKKENVIENIWRFHVQYDYEMHENRKQRRSEKLK